MVAGSLFLCRFPAKGTVHSREQCFDARLLPHGLPHFLTLEQKRGPFFQDFGRIRSLFLQGLGIGGLEEMVSDTG